MSDSLAQFEAFIRSHPRVVVLTGAGVSTGSGIPDYRGPDGAWKRREPVRYQEFTASAAARRRYWARSYIGWPQVESARPNAAHYALARLQRQHWLQDLITQNVDGLHSAAGGRAVDLHGNLARVVCLDCGDLSDRSQLQARLEARNPDWAPESVDQRAAPDGDADLARADYQAFDPVDCERCGGMLKPDVVFFGEPVPRPRVAQCMAMLDAADALLVAGSSLMVFSGFRFARAAHQSGKPVAMINAGRTRADDLLSLKNQQDVGAVLAALADRLCPGPSAGRAVCG